MPYIKQNDRNTVESGLFHYQLGWVPRNAGELNYVVSQFIQNYIKDNGLKYSVVNEMVGALECCKMELNRVVIGPYEDLKMQENGSVYEAE